MYYAISALFFYTLQLQEAGEYGKELKRIIL